MKRLIGCVAVCLFLTLSAMNVFAGSFVSDSVGLKYDVGGGRYLENGWAWCDPAGTGIGYCYYFAPTGYILVNTITPDGSFVDVTGRLNVNGVVMSKIIEAGGYELETASYLAEARTPSLAPSPSISSSMQNPSYGSLDSRIYARNNANVTSFTMGNATYHNAIEFTEGSTPFIRFNSGQNTLLSFDLTGDNLVGYDGDFTVDVYVNGTLIDRFGQRFIELTHRTISFGPHQDIEIRVSVINDYYEEYIRRIYIINADFR